MQQKALLIGLIVLIVSVPVCQSETPAAQLQLTWTDNSENEEGFEIGEHNYEVPPIKDVCAQDLVVEAYKELLQRNELQEEYRRVSALAKKWGY